MNRWKLFVCITWTFAQVSWLLSSFGDQCEDAWLQRRPTFSDLILYWLCDFLQKKEVSRGLKYCITAELNVVKFTTMYTMQHIVWIRLYTKPAFVQWGMYTNSHNCHNFNIQHILVKWFLLWRNIFDILGVKRDCWMFQLMALWRSRDTHMK